MRSSGLATECATSLCPTGVSNTVSALKIVRGEAESKTKSEDRIGGIAQENGATAYLAFSLVSNIRTPAQKFFIKGGELILSYMACILSHLTPK